MEGGRLRILQEERHVGDAEAAILQQRAGIIAADNVRIDGEGGGEFVRISVTDTGSGMTPEVQARVFEPFFTTKGVHKGSGLGLPQVYGFAQQCLGRVTIDSAVGAGTTVTLLLPRSLKLATPAVDGVDRRKHVLLVEDDQDVSALTRELLTSLGYAVSHVAGPDAALRLLSQPHDIDLMVSDLVMPGSINGLELARKIRARQPGLRIVLMTGSVASPDEMVRGEFPILLKPFSVESMANALHAAFATEAAPREAAFARV